MGNHIVSCSCAYGIFRATSKKVLQIVKIDGKILEFKAPVLVKIISADFSGVGIGLSKSAPEPLPPEYELKLGKVYYFLPTSSTCSPRTSISPEEDNSKAVAPAVDTGAVKRIKVVITKHQLQQLLSKHLSVKEILSAQIRKYPSVDETSSCWKPTLEPIPEGTEEHVT